MLYISVKIKIIWSQACYVVEKTYGTGPTINAHVCLEYNFGINDKIVS